MDHYEAVVVDGGPAGLMAAKKAAENGVQVLLLEKESYLGRIVEMLLKHPLFSSRVCGLLFQEAL